MSPWGPLAEFQDRVVAGLIDYVGPFIVASVLQNLGGFQLTPGGDVGGLYWFGSFLLLGALAWALYNGHLAGTTGQSIGMKQSNLRLVNQDTGQLIGSQQGIVRNLLLIPGFCCCGVVLLVDALFPLWDPKKQTLRDKIAKSIVIKQG